MTHSSDSLTLEIYPFLIAIYNAQFDTKKTGFIEFDEFILVWISQQRDIFILTFMLNVSMFN